MFASVAATISRTLDREGAEVRARYLGGLGDDRTGTLTKLVLVVVSGLF